MSDVKISRRLEFGLFVKSTAGKGEMFISFDKQTLLDQLAKKYDLDEFSRNFIRTYINLPKHERDSIKNFANILAAGGDIKPEMSKKFGVEISDSEIEKEVESYRHELEVEKTAEEKSSASDDSKEA